VKFKVDAGKDGPTKWSSGTRCTKMQLLNCGPGILLVFLSFVCAVELIHDTDQCYYSLQRDIVVKTWTSRIVSKSPVCHWGSNTTYSEKQLLLNQQTSIIIHCASNITRIVRMQHKFCNNSFINYPALFGTITFEMTTYTLYTTHDSYS